jgi:hypothetical protein
VGVLLCGSYRLYIGECAVVWCSSFDVGFRILGCGCLCRCHSCEDCFYYLDRYDISLTLYTFYFFPV